MHLTMKNLVRRMGILRNPDRTRTLTRRKPGLVLGLAIEKPGLDNRKLGLQIEKYWI